MWTPKRMLILLSGLTLFLGVYFVYAYFLGGFNGLPVLPDVYVVRPDEVPDYLTPDDGTNEGDTERKLKWAFGAESEEARRPIKLDLRSRRLLLAAKDFEIVKEDGRVKLSPFSAALFADHKNDGMFPEINTVQCKVAYLTLDQPVSNMAELSARKIVAVELTGPDGVTLINNRRSAQKGDDIELRITQAPMFYDERENRIWTDGFVRLLDLKTQPHPTKIEAKGMELQLSEETNPNRPKNHETQAKREADAVSGVKMLLLKCAVEMHLYLDAQSGFLATADKPAPAADEPAEKSHVTITTAGPFHYDLTRERAWFDVPTVDPAHPSASAEQVLVSREHKVGDGRKYDQLVGDHLELQFRKKADTEPKANRDAQSPDKEIETALMTARTDEVNLTMDTENLIAWGTRLFYRSATATTGPQTILTGSPARPMRAHKDGHKIVARELHLIGADKQGNGQQAIAKGPGQIDLYDKSNPNSTQPSHARWDDTLVAVKERDGDKLLDVLTLIGNASFVDQEHKQSLKGQRLQVWLFADTQPEEFQKKREAKVADSSRQKIHKIEAFDQVSAKVPQTIIHQANHLAILVKNEPAVGSQLPDTVPPTSGVSAGTGAANGNNFQGASQSTAGGSGTRFGTAQLGSPQPGRSPSGSNQTLIHTPGNNRKPIELWANNVVAYVTAQGEKKELQQLITQGNVHVYQEGELSDDKKTPAKGVDITGEMLNIDHFPRGDKLVVFGDSRKPARLQLGELLVIGPQVTINQEDNTADVQGVGAMNMPSDTSFEGGKPASAKSRLTIHWTKDMLFDGKDANFRGGVEAFQDGGRLKCQEMSVTLDRTVSFKDGQKANEKAKVAKLVCDRKVWVEDDKRDAAGKRVQFDRLTAVELTMDNQEGPIIAVGPGKVEHLAQGSGDDFQPVPNRASAPGPQAQTTKLTRIFFGARMFSTKQNNVRNAKFYTNVEVFHFPTEDPNAPMDADHPLKGGFYMRSNTLSLFTRQLANKTSQAMQAEGNVFFRTQEFFGNAAVVKYNEAEDQIIFEGTPGNPATLYKKQPGKAEDQEIKANRILYNRKRGTFDVGGGKVISGWLDKGDRPVRRACEPVAVRANRSTGTWLDWQTPPSAILQNERSAPTAPPWSVSARCCGAAFHRGCDRPARGPSCLCALPPIA